MCIDVVCLVGLVLLLCVCFLLVLVVVVLCRVLFACFFAVLLLLLLLITWAHTINTHALFHLNTKQTECKKENEVGILSRTKTMLKELD